MSFAGLLENYKAGLSASRLPSDLSSGWSPEGGEPRTRWPLSRLSRLVLMAWMHDLAEVREPRHPLGLTGRI